MAFDTLASNEKEEALFEATTAGQSYGTKSDSVAYVCPLGDPSRPELTIIKGKDGKPDQRKTNSRFVGHRFRALEDMVVPDCGLRYEKGDLMDYYPERLHQTREVKAGEEFDLTLMEIGLLFALPEYNAIVTGGDIKVAISFRNGKPDGAAKVDGSDLPTVSVRLLGDGSIKDLQPIDVLTYETVADGKSTRKIRTMLPEFAEKFGALAQTRERVATAAGAPKTPKNTRNKNAEEFLKLVAKRA